MLDVVYIAATIALFALVGLIATGVEKLGPRAESPVHRNVRGGEGRR